MDLGWNSASGIYLLGSIYHYRTVVGVLLITQSDLLF